jgi:hypothetical protein
MPINVTIESGQELTVYPTLHRREVRPPFEMHGNGETSKRTGLSSMDMLGTVITLRHASQQLFHQMVRFRDKDTNLTYTNSFGINPLGNRIDFPFSNKFVRNHWPALEQAQLVRRVKRGCYLINPDAILPLTGYAAIKAQWDSLNPGERETTEEMINPEGTETEPAPDGTSSAP